MNNEKKSHSFFDNLKPLSKIGVIGYLYNITDYKTDQKVLKDDYNLVVVETEEQVIKSILHDRADIGIAHDILISYYILLGQLTKDKLLLSKSPDSKYKTHLHLNKKSNLKISVLNKHLKMLKEKDVIRKLFAEYGIQENVEKWHKQAL